MRICSLIFFCFLWFCSFNAGAWESHYLLTYATLSDNALLDRTPNIKVESLASFIEKEKTALVELLKNYEAWAKTNIPNYPPLPANLAFDGKDDTRRSLEQKFLMSLRINPQVGFPLFFLADPEFPRKSLANFSPQQKEKAPFNTLSALGDGSALRGLVAGQNISAKEIVASATEEPDHGNDIGLWQDNDTWFGAIYGFGPQPFGNAKLSYGSQAPFHMSFFHEPSYMYKLAPFLRNCYPEYRISQFLTLSRFAFDFGHPYWGYRFLGNALHYVQDLTQPYHARVVPSANNLKLIFLNILEKLGIKGPAQDLRQLLTNRHLALENYQYGSMLEAFKHPEKNSTIFKVLLNNNKDNLYPAFSWTYARDIIAKEAYDLADDIDKSLVLAMPHKFVQDPSFHFDSSTPGIDLWLELKETEAARVLKSQFMDTMQSFGAHTRKYLKTFAPPQPARKYSQLMDNRLCHL